MQHDVVHAAFAIGDRVRLVSTRKLLGYTLSPGDAGTVFRSGRQVIGVKFDNGTVDYFFAKRFEEEYERFEE